MRTFSWMDEITPLELTLPKHSTASKEILFGNEFSKLMLHNWPKQARNLKLILRSAERGECRVYTITKENRTFPISDFNFFWFEYDIMKSKQTIHCVLL